jgi:hypothetical protein
LDQVYQCGNIDGDILSLPNKIVTKAAPASGGKVNNVEELGAGFAVGATPVILIHKSGFKISEAASMMRNLKQ